MYIQEHCIFIRDKYFLYTTTVGDCYRLLHYSRYKCTYKEPCMVPFCAFVDDVPSCKLEEEGIQGVPMEGDLPFSVHPYASCPQWTLAWIAVDKTTISLNVLTLSLPSSPSCFPSLTHCIGSSLPLVLSHHGWVIGVVRSRVW